MNELGSWGNRFRFKHKIARLNWRSDPLPLDSDSTFLPYGLGHSYGDVCLNDGGTLIVTGALNRFIDFDPDEGTIRCEAGVTLADILELIVPRGWFLPVLPGTKFVTVGGAIGNDVHGKNHHVAGSFGRHVSKFELVRSDRGRIVCSPTGNAELYRATIGGLGLTGLITWAEIKLKKIVSPLMDAEYIKFDRFDEFFDLNEKSEKSHEYTVAWVDCSATGEKLGRGIYMRANHADKSPASTDDEAAFISLRPKIAVPLNFPGFALNKLSIRAFNELYYFKQRKNFERKSVGFNSFFTPLDIVGDWNKIYGKRGFFQYQFVIPNENEKVIGKIFDLVSKSGMASFLVVLKKFGGLKSPGIMSFPKPGITLALDFPNNGGKTVDLLHRLDDIVMENGGRLNPSKDALMRPAFFKAAFPAVDEFMKFRDPKFSSSFIRRVYGK